MKKRAIILIFLLFFLSSSEYFSQTQTFRENILISKFSTRLSKAQAQKILSAYGVTGIKKVFTNLDYSVPAAEKLDRYYYLELNDGLDIKKVKDNISQISWIEDVDYDYIETIDEYIPNDPKYNQQAFLKQIMANIAWDYTKGDKTVVIGIVDTGVDWGHDDLADNIWSNEEEIPDNGKDDDGNGYVDDIRGWDFVSLSQTDLNDYKNQGYKLLDNEDYQKEDNDPSDVEGHGTHCAGLASAVSDNNVGIASVGFNCTIMPLRIGFSIIKKDGSRTGQGYSSFMAKAFVYAANNGADVVNLSFGNSGQMIRDAAQYCYEKGVAVFAAAGNDNTSEEHSALSNCPYAFSVASVALDNRKAYYSNYGSWVEISAPGGDYKNGGELLSTFPGNSYAYMQGTSMACPVTVGAYALLKSYYKDLSLEELIKRLFFTADDIYSVNPEYVGQLGYGRINIYRAITENKHPYFEDISLNITTNNGNNFVGQGDTFNITLNLVNSWGSATDFNFQLFTNDPSIKFITNSFTEDVPEDTTFTTQNAFKLYLDSNVTFHTSTFTVILSNDDYAKTYNFNLKLGYPDVILINNESNEKEYNFIKNYLNQNVISYDTLNYKQLRDSIPFYSSLLGNTDLAILLMNKDEDYLSTDELHFLDTLTNFSYNILVDGKLISSSLKNDSDAENLLESLFGINCKKDFIPQDLLTGLNDNYFSNGINPEIDNTILSSISIMPETRPLFIYADNDTVGSIINYDNGATIIYPGFNFHNIIDTSIAYSFLYNIIAITAKGFYVEHDPVELVEDSAQDIEINAHIKNFSDLNINLSLYWKFKDNTDFNHIDFAENNSIYTAVIPAPMKDTVIQYYIYASNGKDIIILPNSFPIIYSITIGNDTIAPSVTHREYPPSILRKNDYTFYVNLDDNLGIDTTKSIIKYKVTGKDLETQPLVHVKDNIYKAFIHLDEDIELNKYLVYWFEVYDNSKNSNKKKYPVSSIFKFKVTDSIPFGFFEDNATKEYWILEGDWGYVDKYTYEGNYSIRYPQDKVYKNNRNESALFDYPIDFSKSNELYLTLYTKWVFSNKTEGDSGLIEISTDHKKTWKVIKSFTGRNSLYHPEWVDLSEYCTDNNDSVYIRLRCHTDYDGISGGWFIDNLCISPSHPTEIKENNSNKPIKQVKLYQNYPNPFNLSTVISYSIDKVSTVRLEIYNILGRKIITLVNKKKQPGNYKIKWNGRDKNNKIVSNGVYFYKLKTDEKTLIRKMVLLK